MPRNYTQNDRESHLRELTVALQALIDGLSKTGLYAEEKAQYQLALEKAQAFLGTGFSQEELGKLSREAPSLFWLHKEWNPMLEPTPDGKGYREPEWFKFLEPLEQRVTNAVSVLRHVGEY
ncbi:hypothetical protein D3C78_771180 [compost metagenome]